MNATYLAALKANGGPGSDIRTASGTIPSYVRPPAEPSTVTGADPLKFGFVASFNKPGANITGIWMVTTVLAAPPPGAAQGRPPLPVVRHNAR
jgi:hypothetical protein